MMTETLQPVRPACSTEKALDMPFTPGWRATARYGGVATGRWSWQPPVRGVVVDRWRPPVIWQPCIAPLPADFSFKPRLWSEVRSSILQRNQLDLVQPKCELMAREDQYTEVHFQWQWDGQPLPEGLAFDLLIWSEAEHQEHQGTGAYCVIETDQSMEHTVDLDYVEAIIDHGEGTYYWTVIVVQQEPNSRVDVWGEKRPFTYKGPEPRANP